MASVTLTGLWVNDAADLTNVRNFRFRSWPGDERSIGGDVRTYAGGRRRVITTAGAPRKLPYTLVPVSPSDVDWLAGLMGQVVLFRDSHGRSVWGAYLSLKVTDYLHGDAAVDLTLESVSHDLSV